MTLSLRQPVTSIYLNNIEITATELVEREYGRQRILARVPLAGVRHLELAHGFVAERPLLELLFGAALAAAGVALAWRHYAGLFLIGFGLAFIGLASRRGPYLCVSGSFGSRKLQLRGPHVPGEREQFLAAARRQLGLA